ncbi:unnamed protein product [Discula destructiva]
MVAEQFEIYQTEHSGPFTITRTLNTNFATLPLKNLTSNYKDIANIARNVSEPGAYLLPGVDPNVLTGYSAQRRILLGELTGDVAIGGLQWVTANTGGLYMLKPFSRGQVLVNSTDPLISPLVDFRAATDPTDLDLAVALLRKTREIMSAPAMAILGPAEMSPFGPGVETEDQIKDAIRQRMNPTNGHGCCTAAMLPRDLGGVVDDQVRVYGVQRLRLADISFWPMAVGGAPSATMYAAAEKLADIIKAAHSR